MEARIEMFLDDFDGVIETYDEIKDGVDHDDPETRSVWLELEDLLKPLAKRVVVIRGNGRVSEDEMDQIEDSLEAVNELLAELGGMV
jgi:hypothetical protein